MDFCDILKAKVQSNPEISDMLSELKKFFAEVTGIVIFGKRLNAIKENLDEDSEIAVLMKEVENINNLIIPTDSPIHPINLMGNKFVTPEFNTIKQSQVI